MPHDVMVKVIDIDNEHKTVILEKIIQLLKNYNTQEELFLVACIEICSLYEKFI